MNCTIHDHRKTLMPRVAALMVAVALLPAAWAEDKPICEPVYYESGIEPFGWIVTFRVGQEITLPDFQLQPVESSGQRLEFRVRAGDGKEQKLMVPATRAANEPFAFVVHDRQYVLETTHTVLSNRALANNELVVWPLDTYRAQQTANALR